tara:strand:+ start:14177 stop:14761 length:585 start_codon:yes stop_codon:yes gene_type:complete
MIKYAGEGLNIITVIFCYGESSHPWLKKHVTKEMRKKECKEANKIIGGGEIIYLGLKDPGMRDDIEKNKKTLKNKIRQTIRKYKPVKIFTHSSKDPHPDHKAVTNVLLEVLDKNEMKYDVYSYGVWNPIDIEQGKLPKLVVDISREYDTKLRALRCHKSQKITMVSLLWNVIRKDFSNGLKNNCRFAEVFCKIR